MPEETKKPEKRVKVCLKRNPNYGTSRRRGASGRAYTFLIMHPTAVLDSDLKDFEDPKHKQYEPHLIPYKEEK